MAAINRRQIVSFTLGQENFALEILKIQEIIRLVEITPIPDVPLFIEGIFNLRGEVIPVLNLCKMINIPASRLNINSKIIVVRVEDYIFGFIIDDITDILEIENREVEFVKSGFYLKDFAKEVIKLQEKLILLLDINRIVELVKKSISEIIEKKDYFLENKTSEISVENSKNKKILHQRAVDLAKIPLEEGKGKKVKIVVFLLNNEWYGVEEIKIKEILQIQKIFFVPQAPAHIEGVMNVRGLVTPVINLSRFLGMKPSSILPVSKILIIDKNNITVGLLVDAIDEIIQLDWEILQHSLAEIVQEKTKFIKGEFQWQDRVVAILDAGNIIDFKN